MTRSTRILSAAILLDSFTSPFVQGVDLKTEGGRIELQCAMCDISLKPLSAITASLGGKHS